MGTFFSILKKTHKKFNYLSNIMSYLIIYNINNVNIWHAVHTENKYKYKRITWTERQTDNIEKHSSSDNLSKTKWGYVNTQQNKIL